jgi:hypothetical protein
MKLTKEQKNRLIEYNWDVVSTDVNGDEQNCKWLSINKQGNEAFELIVNLFGLTGDQDDVKLLVVATQETGEEL